MTSQEFEELVHAKREAWGKHSNLERKPDELPKQGFERRCSRSGVVSRCAPGASRKAGWLSLTSKPASIVGRLYR